MIEELVFLSFMDLFYLCYLNCSLYFILHFTLIGLILKFTQVIIIHSIYHQAISLKGP